MQKTDKNILFSAGDVVNFLSCAHHTTLDLVDLETPLPKTASSEELELVREKGYVHENRYAQKLKKDCGSFADIRQAGDTVRERTEATWDAMRSGAKIIYQPILQNGQLYGTADFLIRVAAPSQLGDYSYEVTDTKLALSVRARFVIQLAVYSKILGVIQGVEPARMRVVLGDMSEKDYVCKDYSRYMDRLLERFFAQVKDWQNGNPVETYPEPRDHCEICRWMDLCEKKRADDDHLWQVAGIRKTQIKKLQASGISTMADLGRINPGTRIAGMAPQTLENLHQQARLQVLGRETGQNRLEMLPVPENELRGFARLPRPDKGDMFFDMEGDPFEQGGLEYLFGLYFFDKAQPVFKDFWAHSRTEEKIAFEQFMDFVTDRLSKYPNAHIYHYAHYEQTALKKLMSLHGTREAEVDNLLRAGKLVDLYKVVKEGMRISEPSYSIKNLEHFYMESRTGDVQSAGASIVFYEKWKETGDKSLLEKIRDYNLDDVQSTYELRQWLIGLRPQNLAWANDTDSIKKYNNGKESGSEAMTAHEERIERYRQALVEPLPEDRTLWGKKEHFSELVWQLLDFYRREDKPQWWAMFSRMETEEAELIDDIECIGDLEPDPMHRPHPIKKSIQYTYVFPAQETKLKTGDQAAFTHNGKAVSNLFVDQAAGRLTFTLSQKAGSPPDRLSLGPGGPVNNQVLREAVFRFADSLIREDEKYMAIKDLLGRKPPRMAGHSPGAPIIDEKKPALEQIIKSICGLEQSYLFIQGPPGSGKTYTGSHVIVSLLRQGYRVGVSSNSHKAICNLLHGVEKVAQKQNVSFRGVKKSTSGNDGSMLNGQIICDVFKNEEATAKSNQLVAGTAWLFARPEMDQALDFLFVDEAGQVSLANLAAMATSAENLVLLGDQMQLGQPIQGIHPGRSGQSSLEYLLNGLATIPTEMGIFLKTTFRMHPDVCRLISDMVYDSRLEPEPNNINQVLILNKQAHPELLPSGVRFVEACHDGCSQKSETEAESVRQIIASLVCQKYRDRTGKTHALSLENILVVAPYNMQVNLLKSVLPAGARVGTVDKFQGQQAEVVIVSMTTSGETDLPRHIGFLYSKNRLNVALSRARSLAVLVASPDLLSINCSSPEEVALVNALCWVKEYSRRF